MNCRNCSGISIDRINELIGEISLDTEVKWVVWMESNVTNRIERNFEEGKLTALAAHISALSTQFLRHSYVKRSQSDTFNIYDRPRAYDSEFADEGVLEIDFAENFVCEQQDEVQTAHRNQKQLSLFTLAFYFNDQFQAKVLVSNNTVHTKDTIVPYLCKLMDKLPKTLKSLKVWSNGPVSQFKNKFIASIFPHLEKRYSLKIIWNFFATAHGKGCIDGIGAIAKYVVRKHIEARDCIVKNASDMVAAFNRTPSHITIEEMTDEDFINQIENFDVNKIYKDA